MNKSALSFENAPSLWTPVRFFMTAPVFAMLAAILILIDGGQLFQSRWLPSTLAITHIFTLGFISMAILGALFQMLPVVMGVMIPYTNRIASITHFGFTLGVGNLVVGFWLNHHGLLNTGMVLIAAVIILFVSSIFWSINKTTNIQNTLHVVRLALLSLLITVAIGVYLVAGYSIDTITIDRGLTDIHAGWGIAGWIIILLIGMSEQVLPMFLSTKPYPANLNMRLSYVLFSLLLLISFSPRNLAGQLSLIAASIIISTYCIKTLYMLFKRHSRRFDIVVRFWQLSLVSLLFAVVLTLYHNFADSLASWDASVLIAIVVLTGFACSVINGMLYKIVPFLVWLHLRLPRITGKVTAAEKYDTPNVSKVINKKYMLVQFWLQLLSTIFFILSAIFKGYWAYLAAMTFFASNALLLINFILAIKLYNAHK